MSPPEFEDFTGDELDYLNMSLRAFPSVAYGLRAVVTVTSRLSFPVEGPDPLREVIAGAGVRFGDSEIPVEHLPELMPDYYYPIESPDDFVTKVADACARIREPNGANMPNAVLREATAELRGHPPDISDEEIFRMAGIRGPESAPSAGGLARRTREDR